MMMGGRRPGSPLLSLAVVLLAAVVLFGTRESNASVEETEATTILQYQLASAKVQVSGLTSVSTTCRVKGKVSALQQSQEKKVKRKKPKHDPVTTSSFFRIFFPSFFFFLFEYAPE